MDAPCTMLIDGEAVATRRQLDVVNPATGEPFAQAPAASPEDLERAMAAAQRAFPAWRRTAQPERRACVELAGRLIAEHADALAPLLTRENGRPLAFAKEEILGAAWWMGELAKIEIPVEVTEDSPARRVEVHREPLGVVCGLVPWNFPVLLAAWKIAHALLTGNTLVLKPSPFTPLTTLRLGELLKDVFPRGVLNIIAGGDELGPLMSAHPGFAKITFTGSTATGRRIMASAAPLLTRLTLELGGNDPAIVLPDVDVDAVAQQLLFGAFVNSGQVCVAAKRIYIHEDIYEPLRDRLHALILDAKVGDGAEPGTMFGPIQNEPQYRRVKALFEETRALGCTMLQGAPVPEHGYFLPLTLVDNPPEDSRVVAEEAFGPIVPLLRFSDIEDVIARANGTAYGLSSSVWSRDLELARAIGLRLDAGTVQINQILQSTPATPLGGHKQSGLGVENGLDGLLAFTQTKAVFMPKAAA
ncbi:aldehyde dehydrogenase family protein [Pelomonas sp. KK5]|uniref:aldehyde dehydrogenase family protein n=1 Tax=Pelomonas sp. KK5 TaxID=1855730 RepID=UPI00097BEEC5|nr:aldehyde dehydrogenase family protein [Pelomonas sp. KK5]